MHLLVHVTLCADFKYNFNVFHNITPKNYVHIHVCCCVVLSFHIMHINYINCLKIDLNEIDYKNDFQMMCLCLNIHITLYRIL